MSSVNCADLIFKKKRKEKHVCDVISYWLEYLDTVGATRLLQHRGQSSQTSMRGGITDTVH